MPRVRSGRRRPQVATRWADARTALGDRNLRRLLAVWGAWVATDWAFLLTVSLLALDLGGAAAVGVIGAVRVLPAAACAGLVTVLADRVSRPLLIAGVNAAFVGVALAMAVSARGDGHLVWLVAVSAVGSAVSALLRPSMQALLPQLVHDPRGLVAANSAWSTLEGVGTVVGPALTGVLLAGLGPAWVFVTLAAAYAVAAAVAVSIRTPFQPARRPGPGVVRERRGLLRGLSWLLARGARVVFVLFMLQTAMRGLLNVFTILLAVDLVGAAGSEELSGTLFAAVGVGGLAGSVAALALGAHRTRLWFAVGIALWGLPVAALALGGGPAVAWIALALVGLGNALADVFGYSLLNRLLPDDVAGQAWGAFHSVGAGALAAGSLAAPLLVDLLGLSAAMLVTGLALGVSPLLAGAGLRALEARTTPRPGDVALLAGVEVLGTLPDLTLERLACSVELVDVGARSAVVREGAPGREFYVVVEGDLAVTRAGQEVRRLGPGSSFGEVALLRVVPRTATVTAVVPSRLLTLSSEVFVAAVTGHRPTATTADGAVAGLLDADARRDDPA